MTTMTAIGSFAGLPIDHPDALQDVEVPLPELRPHDVLVRVHAVSVNPVDIKRRGKGGALRVAFASEAELNRLFELLLRLAKGRSA